MSFNLANAELIASPITLPCGRVLANRLVKVSMYEHLAVFGGGLPNKYHNALYSKWARGGWGMILTGNFQISSSHLSLGRDATFPSKSASTLNAFRALSAAMHAKENNRPLAIVQLSHTGRQSPRFIGGRLGTFRQPISPSSRRVGDDTKEGLLARLIYKLVFQRPRIVVREDVEDLVEKFVSAAKLAFEAGFDGVELHGAHGYLISQFLSPKLNISKDEYAKPLVVIEQIVTRIRAVTPAHFVLGIKLNAGDYVAGGIPEEVALAQVAQIALLGVDFVEISGGDYEEPVFMSSTSTRQAFFSSFSRKVVQALPPSGLKAAPLVVLTGALRTPSQFSEVICRNHAHLLGIGRLSVLCPDLPHRISPSAVSHDFDEDQFPLPEPSLFNPPWFPKLLGASIGTCWYIVGMRRIANGEQVDINLGSMSAVWHAWAWLGPSDSTGTVPWTLLIIPVVLLLIGLHGWA
ncbi:FMN-linked oxidoreductase [Ramaria rubella]|nr:FMN-linked oxidoreductase [Ramaria rubella]